MAEDYGCRQPDAVLKIASRLIHNHTGMKTKPSVLIVGNFLSKTTGSRGVCEDIAERLTAAGWLVITTSRFYHRIRRLLDMLITTWIRRHDYDIVLMDLFSGSAFIWAELVGFLLGKLGKPYILTLHGGNLPVFAMRWPKRVTHFLNSAVAVTAPSNYLLEQMKCYREHLILIPNPLELNKYKFRLRKKNRPVLMWMRAFHQVYNPFLAVLVFEKIFQKHSQAWLLMGGGDNGDGSLQKTKDLSHLLGISNHVKYEGKIPNSDVPSWIQKGDIFINTTNADNTPVSVLEAMACGLPIVSTNVGGIPYLLENEVDALLVPPNDPEAMAKAIERILQEPSLSMRLSINARKKVEHFDWTVIFPMWEHLIGQVLKSNM